MIISSEFLKKYLRDISSKSFLALPHSQYYLPDSREISLIDHFYRKELIKKFNLKNRKQWSCCQYAEAFKNFASVYFSQIISADASAISVGVIYFKRKNTIRTPVFTDYLNEIKSIEKKIDIEPHAANIILYNLNGKINHLYKDHQNNYLKLDAEEIKFIELIIL